MFTRKASAPSHHAKPLRHAVNAQRERIKILISFGADLRGETQKSSKNEICRVNRPQVNINILYTPRVSIYAVSISRSVYQFTRRVITRA